MNFPSIAAAAGGGAAGAGADAGADADGADGGCEARLASGLATLRSALSKFFGNTDRSGLSCT